MSETTDLLKKQLEEIPSLRVLDSAKDSKFKEWEHLTAAIVDRKLGKEKKEEFDFIHFSPMRISPWEPSEEKEALEEGLNDAGAFLKAAISETDLLGENSRDEVTDQEPSESKFSPIRLNVYNTQTNQQMVNVSTSFNQVISIIDRLRKPEAEKTAAKEKVAEIGEELGKPSPNWEAIKGILHWLLDFSREAFIALIPYLAQRYLGS